MPLPQFLFSWHQIDSSADLDRLKLVLASLPNEKLVAELESKRGLDRDVIEIEILSDSRPAYDLVKKRRLYERAGVGPGRGD